MKTKPYAWTILGWLLGSLWMAHAETEIASVKLVAVNLQEQTLTLQRTGQAPFLATLHKSPRLWWDKKPLAWEKIEDYVNQRVVVRMSVEKGRKPIVRELADPNTWRWLESVRKGIVKGVLKAIDAESVTLEFPDKSQFTYRITARTEWKQEGNPTTPEAFQVGMTVYVAPRLLSNLDTVTLAVSNRDRDPQQAWERASPTVRGVVQLHDLLSKRIVVRTPAGDTREFVYDEKTEFVFGGKPITPAKVKVHAEVTVHRRRNQDGSEYARRITLHPRQKTEAGSPIRSSNT